MEGPFVLDPGCCLLIKAPYLQIAHFVGITLCYVDDIAYSRLRVVDLRLQLDLGSHVSMASVNLLHGIEVVRELNRIRGLARLDVQQFVEGFVRQSFVPRKIDLRHRILLTRTDCKTYVD